MKATEFEVRHRALLHFLLIAAAFLSYLFQRDDIVWAWVKDSPQNRLFERSLFALATVFLGAGASICTWVRTRPRVPAGNSGTGSVPYAGYVGNLFFSVGLGSLAPLSGFVILVVGQALLGFRLLRRSAALGRAEVSQPTASLPQAIRQEAAKWGLFFTMIVFTVLLVDRVAEILSVASLLLSVILNLPHFHHSSVPEKP